MSLRLQIWLPIQVQISCVNRDLQGKLEAEGQSNRGAEGQRGTGAEGHRGRGAEGQSNIKPEQRRGRATNGQRGGWQKKAGRRVFWAEDARSVTRDEGLADCAITRRLDCTTAHRLSRHGGYAQGRKEVEYGRRVRPVRVSSIGVWLRNANHSRRARRGAARPGGGDLFGLAICLMVASITGASAPDSGTSRGGAGGAARARRGERPARAFATAPQRKTWSGCLTRDRCFSSPRNAFKGFTPPGSGPFVQK